MTTLTTPESVQTTLVTMTVLPSGKTYQVATGTTLLKALQAAGEPIVSKCGGEAKCESCHVSVPVGRKSLSKIQRVENEKLDGIIGIGSNSRLACQAVLGTEPVTVELIA
ncbi:MAG: 2Fe-2S iron-sulfur cluster-binding protein [Rhodoferax sp.]